MGRSQFDKIEMTQKKVKEKYDLHAQMCISEQATMFMAKVHLVVTGDSVKLQRKYRGPMMVYRILPGETYGIVNMQDDATGKRYRTTAHLSQLKLWTPAINGEEEDTGPGAVTSISQPD